MGELVFLDGEILPLAEGKVSVEDRGFLFADGIYEVVRNYKGKPFTLRPHLERLERSASGLMLEVPYTVEEMESHCLNLLDRSGLEDSYFYIQVTRGAAKRSHPFPQGVRPTVVIYIRGIAPADSKIHSEGVKVISLPDERWANCHLKTIALLPNVIATEKARRAGANEALLYAPDHTVYEGSSSNAYCIQNAVLYTHPLTHKVLPGITRSVVLEIAKRLGVGVVEEPKKLEEFKAADEVFITSCTREIYPVVQIDEDQVAGGEVGPIVKRLYAAYLDRAAAECGIPSCY